MGLDYEQIKDKSPFDLSGGQKRRVAIAGVIAMKPKVLILDEPTAGLDPKAHRDVLDMPRTRAREQYYHNGFSQYGGYSFNVRQGYSYGQSPCGNGGHA